MGPTDSLEIDPTLAKELASVSGRLTRQLGRQQAQNRPRKPDLPMDDARAAAIQKRRSELPSSQVSTFEKAVSGHSPTAGHRLRCAQCAGSFKAAAKCEDLACESFPYRPGARR